MPWAILSVLVLIGLYRWLSSRIFRRLWIRKHDAIWFKRLARGRYGQGGTGGTWTFVGRKHPPGHSTGLKMADLSQVRDELRESFEAGYSRPIATRQGQLRALAALLEENRTAIAQALAEDLGRPEFEAHLYDVWVVLMQIRELEHHLRRLAAPRRVGFSLLCFPSDGHCQYTPYGVTLIIGTWNLPFQLALIPLAGALAAGNTVLLKTSSTAPRSAELLARLITEYLDPRLVQVVGPDTPGNRPCNRVILELKWDMIFFTGGSALGATIREHAARTHAAVVLELGGKNPVFVDKSARVDLAARRIVTARMHNAGQICVGPDYCLVHEQILDKFLAECRRVVLTRYFSAAKGGSVSSAAVSASSGGGEGKGGSGETTALTSGSPGSLRSLVRAPTHEMGRVVNDRAFDRLVGLLTTPGDEVVVGGGYHRATRYIEPTILRVPFAGDSPALAREVFGPILIVTGVPSMTKAVDYVNTQPGPPLSLYVFSEDSGITGEILTRTNSGNVCVNDCLFQAAHPCLPFGGVGASGRGAYHGDTSFKAFSHDRSVLRRHRPFWLPELISAPFFMFPPWTGTKFSLTRFMVKLMGG